MRTSNVPPLALIALGICIFLRPRRREHPEPARRHVPFEPEERVELSDFILSELQPTPTASITLAHERRVLEAPWLRRDHPSERVLSLSRAALSADTLSHLRVLPRLGAVFCPVPGVASRALLSALLRAERAAGGSIAPFLTDFALRDRERLLTRPDVHRVLFVRHPLARALSVFYAGRRATDLNGPAYRAFLGHVHGHSLAPDERELQPLSLPFFLTFLAAQPAETLWEPFRPITHLCALGMFEYNFVGRMEHLDSHLAALETRLRTRLRPLDPPRFVSNASFTVRHMFASRQRKIKADKLYGADIGILGYDASV